jgi:flavin-dependent dehydrogenase
VGSTVRIAGAGLSGLATALLLARQGAEVEVFERRPGAGGRFAGGWQVLENGTGTEDVLDELRRVGLDVGFPAFPATAAVFLDGLGGVHQVRSEKPYAYFVRRGATDSIDVALREAALAAGVVIRHGMPAPVETTVVATGPRQADGVAKELVFASDLPDTVAVLFDPGVTPTGYAYLFCLHGHATFGVAQVRGLRGLARAKEAAWARFRQHLGGFSVEALHDGGQFMNFCVPAHLAGRDGRWYVGEAAGVQDFLFGLGNRLALRTAVLASSGVMGCWDQAGFERGVVRPMTSTVALRFLYERLGRRAFGAFCKMAARSDFRELLVRLQRPGGAKAVLSRLVMAAWRERSGCRHAPLCSWCRRRER